MKKIILLLVLGILLAGCSMRSHRPEFYNRTTGETVREAVGSGSIFTMGLAAQSTHERYLRVYPECAYLENSPDEFFKCLLDIDIREGRVKSSYVEQSRVQ